MNTPARTGRFTSSMVYKLIPLGKVLMTPEELVEFKKQNPKSRAKYKEAGFTDGGKTYIREKTIEQRMQSTVDFGAWSQPMAWGNVMELYLYEQIGFEYEIVSKDTELHPEHSDIWSGSPDLLIKRDKDKELIGVSEIKCYQKVAFANYTDLLILDRPDEEKIALMKEHYPKEYWQIVSNCCITETEWGEALSFMPFSFEYDRIIEFVNDFDFHESPYEPWMFRFILEKDKKALPFIPDDGYYESINRFRFKVPEADKKLLTSRILEAKEFQDNAEPY